MMDDRGPRTDRFEVEADKIKHEAVATCGRKSSGVLWCVWYLWHA